MKNKPYPTYKPSGVDWLGSVPGHWDVKSLKRSVDFVENGIWGDEPTGIDDILCVRVADFDREKNRANYPETYRSVPSEQIRRKKISRGDLLIEKSGGGEKTLVGCVVQYDFEEDAVCSNFVARMPVAANNHTRFLVYVHAALYSGRATYPSIKQTTGIQNLDADSYLNEKFAFPPFDEQQSIAAYLDRETTRIDGLVAKKQKLIELLKEKRTALISRAVTKGLDPTVPMKPSGVAWLGDVPRHWDTEKLNRVFSFQKGPNAADLTKEYVGQNAGDFPVYSGQTENEGLMGEIDSYSFDLKSDAILVTTVGARAMTTRLIRGRFSLSQNCAVIVPRGEAVCSIYFEGALRPLFDYEKKSISLIMQPSLRFEDLNRFKVPVPSFEEQKKIAAYLDRETAKIDTLVSKVETAIDKLKEYRAALISSAVTGKVDVRNVQNRGGRYA
jgi:type I restriction enzyme S subunit